MIDLPPELQTVLLSGFWQAALVFFRVGAFVSVLPAFGERSVPMRVKLGVALAFAAIVFPAVPGLPAPDTILSLSGFLFTEAVIGLALGMGVRLFALALQMAGSIAAQSTSLSQLLGGAAVEPVPAMGYVLVVSGLAIAVMTGLHVRAAELLISSYNLFPAGQFPEAAMLSDWGVRQVARAFALAFTLAAPFVIASVVYNLALGAINRAMPQLMVAFVGAPVITLGGMFLLFLAAPVMLAAWADALGGFFDNPSGGDR